MIRKLTPLLLSLLYISPYATTASIPATSAQMGDQTDALIEIRDALTDDYNTIAVTTFPLTWGYANTLADIDPNQASSEGLAAYWSGQNSYAKDSISRIEFAQIIIDIIVTKGYLPTSTTQTTTPTKANYQSAYTSITGSSIDINDPIIDDIEAVSENLPIALTNILALAYELKAQTDSCSDYWGDPPATGTGVAAGTGTGITPPTTATTSTAGAVTSPSTPSTRLTTELETNATTVPLFTDATSACDCVKCSVSNSSGYNGYRDIVARTTLLKDKIASTAGVCTTAPYNTRPACRFLLTQIQKGLLDTPVGTNVSEAEGESFINTLSSNLTVLIAPIQTLVLTNIDTALAAIVPTATNPGYPSTSFSSLYSQPTPLTISTACPSGNSPGIANTPGAVLSTSSPSSSSSPPPIDAMVRCTIGGISNPPVPTNEGLDTFIDNLVGMNAIAPPIIAGIPLEIPGLSPAPINPSLPPTLILYIAGTKVEFTLVTIGSIRAWRSTTLKGIPGTSSSSRYLYIPEDEGEAAKTLQQSIKNNFYGKRGGFQATVSKSLMAKSSALDIISEIRKMNTVQQHYTNSSRSLTYSKTPMQILQESSQWRLKPASSATSSDSWLDEVATMSNVSLLRELAVLLAEMRQMQYLQLQASQKQLLIQAISSTSGVSTAGTKIEKLKTDVSNFSAGLDPNPSGGVNPPGQL